MEKTPCCWSGKMTVSTSIFAGLVLAATLGTLALAERPGEVRGTATIVDGDTIRIGAQRVRLWGIDAPEAAQTCLDAQGRSWACGATATGTLARMLWGDPLVTCMVKDTDRYGRTVAACRNSGGDLGARLVAEGMAVAYRRYSTAYVDQEDAAKAEKIGLWSGTFENPESWRHRIKQEAR